MQRIKFSHIYHDGLTRCYVNGTERKVMLVALTEEREGYIIGRTFKFDGDIDPGRKVVSLDSMHAEYEPPTFCPKSRHDFLKVATGMNEVYLVPDGKAFKRLTEQGRVVKDWGIEKALAYGVGLEAEGRTQ